MATRQKRLKRIGIYGGKFDPIHYGHLMCAEWTRQQFKLDRVLFVTSANPPNKKNGVLDAGARHDMVVASVAENPFFEASRLDLEHGGSGYTLLTVQAARQKYGEDVELFYLSSSEYLDPAHKYYLPKWVGFKELAPLCTFLIFPRERTEIEQVKRWAAAIPQARIEVLYVPGPELSSTLIRERAQSGKSIRYMTPFVVQQMIAKGSFYAPQAGSSEAAACNCIARRPIKHVAIYGGQFDPIHYGHLIGAEWARQEYDIDRVIFVTSANPPNNKAAALSAEDRHEMVVAAVSDNPHFEASRLDLDRKTVSYALLTVEQVREQYGEEVKLSMFIASEYLDPEHPYYLGRWMGADRLFELVSFLVFPTDRADFELARARAALIGGARIEVMPAPALPVTSSLIRDLTASGKSIWYTTPWPVQKIIEKQGLYRKAGRRARKTAR